MEGDGILARMRLLGAARGDRPWHSSLLRAMRLVTAALVLMDGVMGTLAGVPLLGEGPAVWVGLGISVAALAGMVLVLARGVEAVRWHAAVVLILLVGLTVGLLATWEAASSELVWWPTRYLTAALMFIAVAGRTWHRVLLVALVLAFHAVMRIEAWAAIGLPWGSELVRQVAAEFGLAAFTASVMWVIMEALLRAGQVTDQAHGENVRETRRAALAGATERSAREVDRFVHDEVLHTLRTIAMDRRDVPAAVAVQAASRLDRLLSEVPSELAEGATFLERLANAAREVPLTVQVEGDESITLPRDVEFALILATLEALRNVARHAGTDRAEVSARREGLTVEVRISDSGRGFDTSSACALGVGSSIRQRMEDVGGEAHVNSVPGSGTTVSLGWAAARSRVTPRFADSMGYGALGEVYPRASLITLPYFAFTLWNAAWLSPALAVPWAGWASALLLTSITAAVLLRALRRGPRPWMAVVLPLVGWGTAALNGWALPEGVTNPYLYWSGTAALAVVVPLTMFHHPALIPITGLGVTAIAAGLTVLRAGPELATGPFLPTITQAAISVGAYLAVRMVFDSLAWEVYRTGEETARAQAEARTRTEFVARLAARMEQRRQAISSFVRAIAVGDLDPAEPGTRARAASLEQTARERMTSLGGELRVVADRLRERGHTVTVRLAEGVPPEVQRRGATMLEEMQSAGEGRPVNATLTIMRSGTAWRTAIVVIEPQRGLPERLIGAVGDTWTVKQDKDVLHMAMTASVVGDNGDERHTDMTMERDPNGA